MACPFLTNAQNFEKYGKMENVSTMLVTSEMFKLLSDIDFESQDPETQAYVDLIENLKNIKVISTQDASVAANMAADAQNYIDGSGMKLLMKFSESGEANVEFYIRPGSSDNYVKELFMFMTGKEDGESITTIMRITGNINLNQISKLAKDMDVPGAKELGKVEGK